MVFEVILVSKGKREKLKIEANNKRDASAKAKLSNQGSICVGVKEIKNDESRFVKDITSSVNRLRNKRVDEQQIISTVSQISVMLDAGIMLSTVLDDVSANIDNKRLKEIYRNMSIDINSGKSMSEAMLPYKSEFGNIVLVMTKLGESTGNMPKAYKALVQMLEESKENRSRFKKAMRSPMITLFAIAVAFVVLIVYVVPTFKDVFAKLGASLPMPTKILLWIEGAFSAYGVWIIIVLLSSWVLFAYLYSNQKEFKYNVDRALMSRRTYVVRRILHLSNMHRYMLVLSELIRAGIPVAQALDGATKMLDNSYMYKRLSRVSNNISKGMSLGDAFEQTQMFENMLLQMIKAGESSGQLEMMVEKVRDYYKMKFKDITDNISVYIEPIMLLLISMLVLLMALGVFMPMWDLGRAVNG